MPWIPRGLRDGVVTSRYPRRPDGYGAGFQAAVTVRPGGRDEPSDGISTATAIATCPTGAISIGDNGPRLDRGRCILCGRCVKTNPEVFAFGPGFETADDRRTMLVVPPEPESDAAVARVRADLRRRVSVLRRSVHVRHVDAGSDGADEWEVAALTNPVYDVHRLGIFFTASPRHADLLLVTGVGAAGMLAPLRETFEVMPEPKVVVASGVDAISGGLVGRGYAASGGVGETVPVDLWIPGAPPTPFGILYAILLAVGLLPGAGS
jgi:Ni,Fe-hydrogenase III small subunit/ferredoxin